MKPESYRLFAHLKHHTISMFKIHPSIGLVEKFVYLMSSIKFHIDLSFCPVALDYLDIFFFYLQFVLKCSCISYTVIIGLAFSEQQSVIYSRLLVI